MAAKYRCAGLVLHEPSMLRAALFKPVASVVEKVLYLPLPSEVGSDSSQGSVEPNGSRLAGQLTRIYSLSSLHASHLDVRTLLPCSYTSSDGDHVPVQLSECIDGVLYTNGEDVVGGGVGGVVNVQRSRSYQELLRRQPSSVQTLPVTHLSVDEAVTDPEGNGPSGPTPIQMYGSVVVGGTFDRFHNGHRLLLAQSALRAEKRILVGVTDGPLLTNKALAELIEPLETRMENVQSFLADVKPSLQIDVVRIVDVMGPTAWDGTLECLMITADTVGGGETVNAERKKRGLPEMTVEYVDMVALDGGLTDSVAAKLSSTELRKQLLGEIQTPKVNRTILAGSSSGFDGEGPFVIGLTGGIASGKTSICKRLAQLGAGVIDCDKLGHAAYEPGAPAFTKVVERFGEGVIGEDGRINRKALGGIVFGSKGKMKELTDIVWPEISKLAQQEMQEAWRKGCKVCILDAAVLLEAEWDHACHEVWVAIVPPKEALKRIVERDHVSAEVAQKKLASQITNQERVDHAHVLLSTLWEPAETQQQVEKAWKLLMERIGGQSRNKSSL